MELTNDQYRLIEGYLDGTLEPSEMDLFLSFRESSVAFREELQQQMAVIASLKAQARVEFKAKLKKDFQEISAQQEANGANRTTNADHATMATPSAAQGRKWIWYSMAASVLLLIGLTFFMQRGRDRQTHEAIFADYFHPYPAQPHPRVDGSAAEMEAIVQYREGNYSAAIPLFQQSLPTDSTSALIQLYLGNAWLSIDSLQQARSSLQIVRASNNPQYKQQGEWFLALIALKSGDLKTAKQNFQSIIASASPFASQAQKILKALE